MSDIGSVLQQVSQIGGALAVSIGQITGRPVTVPGYGAAAYGYPPATAPALPADNLTLGGFATAPAFPGAAVMPAPAAPAASPPASQSTGVMAALSNLWQGIVKFFKNLFGGSSTTRTTGTAAMPTAASISTSTTWPAASSDARMQAFSMLPTGNGTALGFVPVNVQRTASAVVATAAGFGQFAAFWQNDQLYFQENGGTPRVVTGMTSSRQADGSTLFVAALQNGKTASFDIGADGRTLRYQGFSVTLS